MGNIAKKEGSINPALDRADEDASEEPLAPANDCKKDSDDKFPAWDTPAEVVDLDVTDVVAFLILDLLGDDCTFVGG